MLSLASTYSYVMTSSGGTELQGPTPCWLWGQLSAHYVPREPPLLQYVYYPEFDGVQTGIDRDTGQRKPGFEYALKRLLGVPRWHTGRSSVLPLAIRSGQNAEEFPMFTSDQQHTDNVTRLAAKLMVQVADSLAHEVIDHLRPTQLLVGTFVCATYRVLPKQHHVYRSMKQHFSRTAFHQQRRD